MTDRVRGGSLRRLLTLPALAVAILGTALCVYVIYRTAQVPDGDGTGMQWVVLGPLGLLFFGLVLPAFILGVYGLRMERALLRRETHKAGEPQPIPTLPLPQDIQQRETRAFGVLAKVLIALAVLIFGVLPLLVQLILLFVE